MDDNNYELVVRAPGRICLFGEHQDYLGYPVIAGAINRYIWVKGNRIDKQKIKSDSDEKIIFSISLPDLEIGDEIITINKDSESLLKYRNDRDYLVSCINVAIKEGVKFKDSWKVEINGNIPINAGASSSSAMVIAWLKFLYATVKIALDPRKLGELGYRAEVVEFNESGGMMDHFSSAVGHVIFVKSKPVFSAEKILSRLDGFVLANSGIKKKTVQDLKNTKERAVDAFDELKDIFPKFDPYKSKIDEVEQYLESLNSSKRKIAYGNLVNRDLTVKGYELLKNKDMTIKENQISLGKLILHHHHMLSEYIGVSIPEIDKMVEISMENGAYGAKINGSGFGGTMFAYAPDNQIQVLEALKENGYEAWAVDISDGAKIIKTIE